MNNLRKRIGQLQASSCWSKILLFCPLIPPLFYSCTPNREQEKPNVILILTDDQGYGDIAAHGNSFIHTPNLDRLYTESTRLTNFHVCPTSSPTRAALLTGRYNNRTGVWHTVTGRSRIREDEITMGQIFSENDYETGMFGKWHLGFTYPARPMDKGFKTAIYLLGGAIGNTPDYWDNDYFNDHYMVNGEFKPFQGYCTDVWFSEAIKFIRNNKDKPFLCYLATNVPHGPYYIEDKYSDPYKNNPKIPNPNFYGMITEFDENMGKLRKELEDLGIADNTILIFMTDNGTASGVKLDEKGYPTDIGYNAGMRGQKGSPYDGGHRVPCYIHWPDGKFKKGADFDKLTAHIDILPTLAEMCRLKTPQDWKPDGISLVGALKRDSKYINERILIVDSQRKEVPEKWRLCSVMSDKWRLINGRELYNIQSDPGQKSDVAAKYPEVVQKLRESYEKWFADVFNKWETCSFFVIGDTICNETMLTSHDWMGTVHPDGKPAINSDGEETPPFNQMQIRNGLQLTGYWDIDVRTAGDYIFELRRWPRETDVEICSGMPASENPIPGGKPFTAGIALEINQASIKIGNREESKRVRAVDKSITFRINLQEGKTQLSTKFTNGSNISMGAYFVYITKTD